MSDQAIPPLIGKYSIVRPLGRGGMGQVYLAEDTRLQRQVAIKCLRPELNDPQWQQNLRREARVLARLNHPNIVQVHDIIEVEDSLAIVTEYVAGRNLHILLREREPGYAECVQWLAEISAGLAAAHREGISHNDLKPENILIGPGNSAKINDFGIATLDSEFGGDILALANIAETLVGHLPETNPQIEHLLQRMQGRRAERRPGADEVAAEFRHIWLESSQAETPLPVGSEPPKRRRLSWLALGAVAIAVVVAAVSWKIAAPGQVPHRYVAVLSPRLDVDDSDGGKMYALLASSVQQGLYDAVMRAPGFSLVSPAETGQQEGSPRDIGLALQADEVLVPQLKCLHQHCELSTERLVGPEFRVQKQRSTSLLPELTLEAYQIAARQWHFLYGSRATPASNRQSISEPAYRRFLELYQAAHFDDMPLDSVLEQLDLMFAEEDVRFLPATNLYVYAALERFHDSGEQGYLERARGALKAADRWSENSALLHQAWLNVALESRDFAAAAREIGRLEQLGVDEALVLALRGHLYHYQGDFNRSSGYFLSALELRPTRTNYNAAIHGFYYAGDDERALELADAALARFADDGKIKTVKGLILLDRGELDAAVAELSSAIDVRPSAATHANLGLAYLLRGDYLQASEEMRRAMELGADGRAITLTLNLADSLSLLGRTEEAGVLYQSLVTDYQQAPDSIRPSDVAQALAQLGEYQAAIQMLQSVDGKTAESYFSAALVYTLAGQSLAATAKVRQALDANLGPVWFRFPWFDPLCAEADFVRMLASAGDPGRCSR